LSDREFQVMHEGLIMSLPLYLRVFCPKKEIKAILNVGYHCFIW
jgi:hypothetical protein